MATPGELVKKMSEVLTIPEPTMAMYDRALRDAGLLTKGGRGRSSAHRTPLDAARLLIAALVTTSPARAVDAVTDYGVLEFQRSFSPPPNPEKLTLARLCGKGFETSHTFEEAMAAIIGGFGAAGFMSTLEEYGTDRHDDGSFCFPHIGVKVWNISVCAEINVQGNKYFYLHPTSVAINEYMHSNNMLTYDDSINEGYIKLKSSERNIKNRYKGIRTERSLCMPEISPIAEFVSGVSCEN